MSNEQKVTDLLKNLTDNVNAAISIYTNNTVEMDMIGEEFVVFGSSFFTVTHAVNYLVSNCGMKVSGGDHDESGLYANFLVAA